MWIVPLFAVASFGADCPDVREQISRAWERFDDAEVADARRLLAAAHDNLACQTRILPARDLMELHRLDALVSLSADDPKGAVYATIRAVAADHIHGEPPAEYGPDLSDLYRTWAARLGDQTLVLEVHGGSTVWVDGRRADRSSPLEVVEGEHLIQVEDDMGIVRSLFVELSEDQVLHTGSEENGQVLTMAAVPAPVVEDDVAVLEGEVSVPGRRRPVALGVIGAASVAVGGAALGLGWSAERQFLARDVAPRGDCHPTEPCYDKAIRSESTRIRALYGSGYGLAAVGAGLMTAFTIGLPVHVDGSTVGVHWRW